MASKRKKTKAVARKSKSRAKKKVIITKSHLARPMSEEDKTKAMRFRERVHSPGVSTAPGRRRQGPAENYLSGGKRTRFEWNK